ncbi:MAG: hypothetical protein IJ706_06470, partial [Clostridia bacterium]|nr:hypothetical protein [Clostridia bacterium]
FYLCYDTSVGLLMANRKLSFSPNFSCENFGRFSKSNHKNALASKHFYLCYDTSVGLLMANRKLSFSPNFSCENFGRFSKSNHKNAILKQAFLFML